MSTLDWLVMTGTLAAIVIYGVMQTRSVDNVKSYLQGDRDLKWWTIGLSVMAHPTVRSCSAPCRS